MKVLIGNSGIPILFKRVDSKVVDIRYFIRCGAIDEVGPKDEGLCHALEHMVYAGTNKRTWLEINRAWEGKGAWYNAHTHHDKTHYEVNCLKKHWKDCYEVLADMLYNPIFPEDRWEDVEKQAVISEIQSNEDDAGWLLSEELYRDALGSNYHPVVGNIENIQKASIEDLKHFYNRYYCGKNVVLSIAGDLTEAEILKVVNRHDGLRSQRVPKRQISKFTFNTRSITLKKKELEQCIVETAMPLEIPRTIKGRVGLSIACNCLSQWVFEELREHRGLCYDASADLFTELPRKWFLSIDTATDKDRLADTRKIIKRVRKDFLEKGLTTERIRNNIAAELYETAHLMESTANTTLWLWDAWEENIIKDPFKYYMKILENLNFDVVKRAASKALVGRTKTGMVTGG